MTCKIVKSGLIGTPIEVTKAKNKAIEGINGIIISETKNSFVLDTQKGVKRILKSHILVLTLTEKGVCVHGMLLAKRPKDRIKQKVRRKK